MAKNLGAAVIDLLDSDRVELRAAAATVLAAVGKGDKAVEAGLVARLADPDPEVRRLALDGLASLGATGIAASLVPLLRGTDDSLAERAAQLLAAQGAAAEPALRKEIGAGPIPARRTIAQLLLRRGTTPAVEAVLDQLGDPELGEQVLQLVRAVVDGDTKLADLVEKLAVPRAAEVSKALAAKPKKRASEPAATADPQRLAELAALLRLLGYLARPSLQPLLLKFVDAKQPQRVRLAAIAGLRRIVAQSETKGTERAIETLIELANSDDAAIAQAAVDTLKGARIPESLAKAFAALAKSKHVAAQKLAMERLPAGGGASALKALIEALGGDDPTARDAAARGLAKAPEAVLPVVRALLAAKDEQVARRYAGIVRTHRGHVSTQAVDELVEQVRAYLALHDKKKATADQLVLERVLAELVADVAPQRHVELLFERAKKLRKAGKSVEAFGSLKPLLRSRADLDAAMDDEQRFFLAVLSLEAAGDGIIRASKDDPVFAQLARLATSGYPVAKQLAREDDVSDQTIYALGFRLLESGDARNEALGAELLQGIIDERPRSKLAKVSRNKLKLSGYLDDA